MSKNKSLGEFEIFVLAALIHLNDNAYGKTIRQEIESKTQRDTSVGAIYTTLSRLEKKKLVVSNLGGATNERGGRSKRYFKITDEGLVLFKQSVTTLNNILRGISIEQ